MSTYYYLQCTECNVHTGVIGYYDKQTHLPYVLDGLNNEVTVEIQKFLVAHTTHLIRFISEYSLNPGTPPW